MEQIDRLGWAAGICFTAFGLRIGLRTNTPPILETVRAHLPPGWRETSRRQVEHLYSLFVGNERRVAGVRRYHLLYADTFRLVRTMDLDRVFEILETDLETLVAARARNRVFVHAGVVGWRGRAIVIPGESGCGKTDLVAALVKRGAAYYSDEYAVFDRRGRVHPYPRPLLVRGKGQKRVWKLAADLGGVTGAKPIPVGLMLLTRYQPERCWRPRKVTSGQSLLALLAHTVAGRRRPAASLDVLREAVVGCTTLRGVRGEAEEVAGAILRKAQKHAVDPGPTA